MTTDGQQLQSKKPLGHERAENAPIALLGIVVAVDEGHGSLVLKHGGGTHTDPDAEATLLRKVQVGDPVKVVAEGCIVRTLEPLGPFARPA